MFDRFRDITQIIFENIVLYFSLFISNFEILLIKRVLLHLNRYINKNFISNSTFTFLFTMEHFLITFEMLSFHLFSHKLYIYEPI